MKKILIVEDDEPTQNIYTALLKDSVEVLQARAIPRARYLFYHEDIDIIVFDGNVIGEAGQPITATTISLIGEARQKKFTGPMIATSGTASIMAEQIAAGCDYACPKKTVPDLVKLLISKLG